MARRAAPATPWRVALVVAGAGGVLLAVAVAYRVHDFLSGPPSATPL